MKSISVRNRQTSCAVDTRVLRQVTRFILDPLLEEPAYEIAIHLVNAGEMAKMNETFLRHAGSTDVITFDYTSDPGSHNETRPGAGLIGDIFISVDDAISQGRQFRTIWQSELARYVVHGILHLKGFDDLKSEARKKMKREENRLLARVADEFTLSKLGSLQKGRRVR
jgi:probable rRNA maturation factor